MTNSQNTSYSQSLTNFQPEHIKEFRDSAIASEDIVLNFTPLEGDSDAVTSSRKGIEEAMIEKELV
jgi:hypothetical protein